MKGQGPLIVGVLAVLLSTTAAAVAAHADVVELKTGQRVEGTLKQATPASVSVEVGGQTITFEGDKVRAIYYGAAPTPAPGLPSPIQEAMRALRGLESITKAGVVYRDYGPRVSDARIVVDRYLLEPSDAPVKAPIGDAMGLYELALAARRADISKEMTNLGDHPMVARCPAVSEKVAARRVDANAFQDSIRRHVIVFNEVPAILACASDKIAEAEKLVGR